MEAETAARMKIIGAQALRQLGPSRIWREARHLYRDVLGLEFRHRDPQIGEHVVHVGLIAGLQLRVPLPEMGGEKAAEEEAAVEDREKMQTGSKAAPSSEKKSQRTRGPQKLKFSYKEQKDYETIEGEIAALEEKIAALEKNIEDSAHDFVKLNQLMAEKEEAEAALEEKMERWMYLEELAAKIAAQ